MNDPQIRQQLKLQFLSKDGLVFDEVGILNGKTIADVAIFSPTRTQGFEIKSGCDTLDRLKKQSKDYDQVFDYNTVVTETKYADKVSKIIPDHWGILIVEDNILKLYKQSTVNPNINKESLIKLLWKSELRTIIVDLGLFYCVNSNKNVMCDLITDRLSLQQIKSYVFKFLSGRGIVWKEIS